MNYIWCGMVLFSFVAAAVNGCMEETAAAAFDGAAMAVSTALSLAGALCFWTGILRIAEKSGVSEKFRKLLSPLIKRLFPNTGRKAKEYITMNIAANILGMGNAATPMGIKAMGELDRENKTPQYASAAMCLFVVLNTTSFQLLPSTVIAMRTACGSKEPFAVILPIWLASAISVTSAAVITRLVCKVWRK